MENCKEKTQNPNINSPQVIEIVETSKKTYRKWQAFANLLFPTFWANFQKELNAPKKILVCRRHDKKYYYPSLYDDVHNLIGRNIKRFFPQYLESYIYLET